MRAEAGPPVGWQRGALKALQTALIQDENVLAAVLFGSCAEGLDEADRWSDIDLLVFVADDRFDEAEPHIRWVADAIGSDPASMNHAGESRRVIKAIDEMGRSVDFVMVRQSSLGTVVPGRNGLQASILFSPSDISPGALLAHLPLPSQPRRDPEALTQSMARARFLARESRRKAQRGDRLIALHLALRVTEEVCVRLMAMRDRRHGSVHHPSGREDDSPRLTRIRGLGLPVMADEIIALAASADELHEALVGELLESEDAGDSSLADTKEPDGRSR